MGSAKPKNVNESLNKAVEGWIVIATNCHEEITEEDLIEIFGEYGKIKNIHLNLDRRSGYVKGYGLIEFLKYDEAKTAINALDKTQIMGKIINVDFAFVQD